MDNRNVQLSEQVMGTAIWTISKMSTSVVVVCKHGRVAIWATPLVLLGHQIVFNAALRQVMTTIIVDILPKHDDGEGKGRHYACF